MGESLEFRELLDKKKTIGEWRAIEELTPVIDELVEPDALLKFVNSALKVIDEVTGEHRFSVLARLEIYVSKYLIGSILDVAAEYTTKVPLGKLVPYIVMGAIYEILRDNRNIEKYAKLLNEYADTYPEETVKGLLMFTNIVDSAIGAVKREVAEYGKPLI
jgi:hypothetical protein